MTFNPKDYGAKTRADVGVFLVGAFFGGAADAVINVAGFAEPFVFAGLCGAGALGAKKLVLDYFSERSLEIEDHRQKIEQMTIEADLLDEKGEKENASLLRSAIEKGEQRKLSADSIRDLYMNSRSESGQRFN